MVSYLGRFQGEKAQGARSELQYNLRILVLLRNIAKDTLADSAALQEAEAALAPFRAMMYE